MEMHADGLPHRLVTGAVEAERNSCFIEVGIEARGSLEGPDVELIGIFERHFGLVGDRLCHGTCLGLFAGVLIAVRAPCDYDLDQTAWCSARCRRGGRPSRLPGHGPEGASYPAPGSAI